MAVIFRRIKGRLIPITVTKTITQGFGDGKNISLRLRQGAERVGEVWADQSAKRPHRFHVGAHLNPDFRAKGLGKELYKRLASIAQKFGAKTFVGTTENVAPISKVRASLGKTRKITYNGRFSGTTFVTLLKRGKKNA